MGFSVHTSLLRYKYPALAVLTCFSLFNLFIYHGSLISDGPVVVLTSEKLRALFADLYHRHEALDIYNTRSRVYDDILLHEVMYDFLRHTTLEQRCNAYFQSLALTEPHWCIDPATNVQYNLDFNDFEGFKAKIHKQDDDEATKAKNNGVVPPNRRTEHEVRQLFEANKERALSIERTLHDFIAHFRVFDKCFLKTAPNDRNFVEKQKLFLSKEVIYVNDDNTEMPGASYLAPKFDAQSLEKKIFSFLTFEYPIFKRWDAETVYYPGRDHPFDRGGASFLKDFQSRLNGKGIVMTLPDKNVQMACALIRILRAQENKYPIQVVYHSKLSEQSQVQLIKAARSDYRGFPSQEIWFVDVSRSFKRELSPRFEGFSNKILACVFNSFEEFILLDADTVVVKNIDYFFDHKKYKETGAYFFRDRVFTMYRKSSGTVLLKKLLPSLEDSVFFNIPQTSSFSLDNEFFQGLSHFMESGLVVMNRKRHFTQPFMMATMALFNPITGLFYGDKEFFFTALVLAGDENYAFNGHPAAAIGELTPDIDRSSGEDAMQSYQSKELCSNHPAHISDDDDELLWFNSGFQFCGNTDKIDPEKEFRFGTRFKNLRTVQEFKEFFASPLKIRQAIIPPQVRPHEPLQGNLDNEPVYPWITLPYCDSYCWCGYSLIGGSYKDGVLTKSNKREGRIIEFSEEQVKYFDELAQIWNEPSAP